MLYLLLPPKQLQLFWGSITQVYELIGAIVIQATICSFLLAYINYKKLILWKNIKMDLSLAFLSIVLTSAFELLSFEFPTDI